VSTDSDLVREAVARARYAGEANIIRASARSSIEWLTYWDCPTESIARRNLDCRNHLIQVAVEIEAMIEELLSYDAIPTVRRGHDRSGADRNV
jgi:hypothetical protein